MKKGSLKKKKKDQMMKGPSAWGAKKIQKKRSSQAKRTGRRRGRVLCCRHMQIDPARRKRK